MCSVCEHPQATDLTERRLADHVERFARESPANRLHEIDNSRIFETPLVGFADGDDPLFQEYKSIIGPFHLTPRQAIEYALAEQSTAAHASVERLSVICWVLPIAERTRLSNRGRLRGPSRRWAHTKHYGEQFNDALREHVVSLLRDAGYLAIAPARSPLFRIHRDGIKHPPASTWSERHIQYAAGLGTFGLSDGFITPKGVAMRCGSVVTNLPLRSSPRRYRDHTANCLFRAQGDCAECIRRCPAGAITREGHDKDKCQAYIGEDLRDIHDQYQVTALSCGLCQTGVPCEAGIPSGAK